MLLLELLLLTVGPATAQVRVHGSVYGGGALANANDPESAAMKTATVNLTGGTIDGDVYGGGLGQLAKDAVGTVGEVGYKPAEAAVAALVGNTVVNLNGTETEVTTTDAEGYETKTVAYKDNCVVKGRIFGCNNLNGTPKGDVIVHIFKTQGYTGHFRTGYGIEDDDELEALLNNIDDAQHTYELKAVYGGGNLAAYVPTDLANAKASVIVDGCDLTSIQTVYGGGNAASTPATSVTINGTYEIEEVFGGGNGKDALPDGSANPGANVGFKDYSAVEETYSTKDERQTDDFKNTYVYGSGEASVTIVGGRIHRVFGGSNTKGNVRISAVTMLEDHGGCHFLVDQAYGGGKSAPMDGDAQLHMACIPGLRAAYGGAEEANVDGNVRLTITNGTFDRVFGGNNISGNISGTITVDVEETGCRPVIIGQLYGGGNQAAYTAPTGQHGPTLNVRSFTSIGEIYGGGYGKTAVVKGDTYVYVDEYEGLWKDKDTSADTGTKTIRFSEFQRNDDATFVLDDDGNRISDDIEAEVTLPVHEAGKIGGIGIVFGGGNAAEVDGNTNVFIGTQIGEYVAVVIDEGEALDGCYTRSGAGTSESPYTYTAATGEAVKGTAYYKKYAGVDIRGDVFGGGNNATVTGNTNVQIGRKAQ